MPVITLTNLFVKKSLQCPDAKNRIEYCDTEVQGLYIEVRKTSPDQGTYYYRFKNSAKKTCHQKLGRTDDITLPSARSMAKQFKAKIQLGADPRAEAHQEKSVLTLSDFAINHYMPYVKKRKRTWRNDESMLLLRILPVFGDTPLNKIQRYEVQKFHSSLKDVHLSGSTCDHHLKLMRHLLNLAVEWDMLDKNPISKVSLFKDDNKKERYMTPEELDRLVQVLKTNEQRTVCKLILFLLSTGARLNEAMQANWEHIDTVNRVWKIPALNSKSKKIRSVPLNSSALQILGELKANGDNECLFLNSKTGKRYVDIKKTWHRVRTTAGLPNLRLHDLRHQYASMLVNNGRSLYEVQQILGHSDPAVTQRYAHLSTRALQEAAETASDCIGITHPQTAQR